MQGAAAGENTATIPSACKRILTAAPRMRRCAAFATCAADGAVVRRAALQVL
jgi:Ni,Fe-hydrogenase III small subunit